MNNIYYKSSHGQSDTSEQITSDGNDAVFNGISDWVYEGAYKNMQNTFDGDF